MRSIEIWDERYRKVSVLPRRDPGTRPYLSAISHLGNTHLRHRDPSPRALYFTSCTSIDILTAFVLSSLPLRCLPYSL